MTPAHPAEPGRGSRLNRCLRFFGIAAAAALAAGRLDALMVSDLLSDPKMTPSKFAGYFTDFKFEIHPFDVQDPEDFLTRKSGDCIDYAVLADYVLKRDGYGTRLIRVEMLGKDMGHAVCYITENKAYLDYNNRTYFFTLQRCGSSLREIATKVAESFAANWTFAQEFTYSYKTSEKHALMTVVKTDPPSTDPDLAAAGKS
jgi:transglutaminase superfamily protein